MTLLLVETVLGVAALAALSAGLLIVGGADLRRDPDHATLVGTGSLAPRELGEQQTPPAE